MGALRPIGRALNIPSICGRIGGGYAMAPGARKGGPSGEGPPFENQIRVADLVAVTTAGATTTSTATARTAAGLSLGFLLRTTATGATATTTTAAAGEVRVGDDKAAALQTLDVINIRALEKRRAFAVHDDLDAEGLDQRVVFVRRLFKAEDVFHPARLAGSKGDPDKPFFRFLLSEHFFEFQGG